MYAPSMLQPGDDQAAFLHGDFDLQVKDSGSGISPQDIPTLFTKFSQAGNSANRNAGGTGIGLAICKRYSIYSKFQLYFPQHTNKVFMDKFFCLYCPYHLWRSKVLSF